MEVIKIKPSSAKGKRSRRASLKKAIFRHFRSARIHQKNKSVRNNLLMKAAPISRVSSQEGLKVLSQSTSQEDNGVVRMNILVKKEDLERVFELMRNNNNINHKSDDSGADDEEDEEAFSFIEERLNQLRKKHRRHGSWSRALQTIPEDIF